MCGIAEYGLAGFFLIVSCTTDSDLGEYGLAGYSLPAGSREEFKRENQICPSASRQAFCVEEGTRLAFGVK